jgi:hypothetical protein
LTQEVRRASDLVRTTAFLAGLSLALARSTMMSCERIIIQRRHPTTGSKSTTLTISAPIRPKCGCDDDEGNEGEGEDAIVGGDQGGTEVATVTIIIHGDNSERAAADDSESTTEDAPMSYDRILENDSDLEKDALTVKKVEVNKGKVGTAVTLPSGAKMTVTSDGGYTFDPSGQYKSLGDGDEATATFVYTILDGNGGTDEATVMIAIVGRNDAPDAEDDVLLDPLPAASPVGGQNVLSNDSDTEECYEQPKCTNFLVKMPV